jgi:uridine phosphorylase
MKKSGLLGIEDNLPRKCVLICGEDLAVITNVLKELNITYDLVLKKREFSIFVINYNKKKLTLAVTGLGSASIELILQELLQVDINVIGLAGTCGISKHFELGEPIFINQASYEFGSPDFYDDFKIKTFYPNSKFKPGELKSAMGVSSDSFYAIGGVLEQNRIVYKGAKTKKTPPAVLKFEKLYNSNEPYVIDMETAFFFAFQNIFKNFKCFCVRAGSNYVPFDPKDFIKDENTAVKNSLIEVLRIINE